jgi:hypothetical protein
MEDVPRMVFALLRRLSGCLPAVLLSGVSAWAGFADPACAADRKGAVTNTVLPATTAPSGAEIVGKLLSDQTRASDPDVPLPQPNLNPRPPGAGPLSGPSLYGRQEDGGGVVGLKFPIPVSRATQ